MLIYSQEWAERKQLGVSEKEFGRVTGGVEGGEAAEIKKFQDIWDLRLFFQLATVMVNSKGLGELSWSLVCRLFMLSNRNR